MTKISAAIATHNEESNIGGCLKSIKDFVDEIIIVDGNSEDQTVEIASSFGAKVTKVPNNPMFHNMKQKAFDLSSGAWILYLDADERVSPRLAQEIQKVVGLSDEDLREYEEKVLKENHLFVRHQKLLEQRDGQIGDDSKTYTAFFFPRKNYFLGKYLKYGGVYPDGVIRLFKKGKAYLPCKDIHEQMVVEGRVGWLKNDLLHLADPTFGRYLERNRRYINLIVQDLKTRNVRKNIGQFVNYMVVKPIFWFTATQIRHKGILDGFQGIIFSFFSALRFPRAYWRYLKSSKL